MPNLFEPQWDSEETRPGFAYRRAKLGAQAGGERLGASLFEIPPGEATFPYHAHSANEELLIVIAGRPSLRSEAGWRELETGEVVSFPRGLRGAHQIANAGGEGARVLVVSEMNAPEICFYPDSDKISAMTRPPGGKGGGDELFAYFKRGEAADYWDGEEPPRPG